MTISDRAADAVPDLEDLLRSWKLNPEDLAPMVASAAVVLPALDGLERELREALAAAARADNPALDEAIRRGEPAIVEFWRDLFRRGLDQTTIERAALIGREYLDPALGGRWFLVLCERVLRRAFEAASVGGRLDNEVSARFSAAVLMAADVAMTSAREQFDGPNAESDPETETLRRQVRELEALVHVDSLTKLFNRRHFDRTLEAEVARSKRYGQALCLLLCDMDSFKQFNDLYGHSVGDEVLCHVGKVLQSTARRSDIVARYGGEEFAIILTATSGAAARCTAERMRKAVESDLLVRPDGLTLRITVSVGYAIFDGEESPRALVDRADAALYRSKQAGRNRVSD